MTLAVYDQALGQRVREGKKHTLEPLLRRWPFAPRRYSFASFDKLHLAWRIAAFRQSKASRLGFLPHALPDVQSRRGVSGSLGTDPEVPLASLDHLVSQTPGGLICPHTFREPAPCLVEQAEIVILRAVSRINLGQLPITILGDRIVLARQHAHRRGEPAEYLFLFGLRLADAGKGVKLFQRRSGRPDGSEVVN